MKVSLSLFIVFLIITILSIYGVNKHCSNIGGDAISGYSEDGMFYIMTSDKLFLEVSKETYVLNISLFIILFISAVISAVSMLMTVILFGVHRSNLILKAET